MKITYKTATLDDLEAMIKVGDTLFDYPIKPERAQEFLSDPRHHLLLAYHENTIVGMASGLHYVHPDKDPQLFINEASVVESYQNKGIGRALIQQLCEYGKNLGCKEAWVATEKSNLPAQRAYLAANGIQDIEEIVLFEFNLKE
ncbi:GNAT family N-acetyltransferase [Aquimarina gracilis]|uniref:GNAT family N-acetyltransferase n=1 Tax=Aquimarina gracilis TaxID=874422 RepID=A0ABU6A261_9FLAO|nr:GNAT family N-acetyltransferase [Aquimarina gracilis]MEB3348135.1 GNAT family N-acetyltransferase [Aquimarina gracilis]